VSVRQSFAGDFLEMLTFIPTRWLVLLLFLITACASSAPDVREDDESPGRINSWAEARAEPTCVVPLCDGDSCTLCSALVGPSARRTLLRGSHLRNPLAQLEAPRPTRAAEAPAPMHASSRAAREAPHLSSAAKTGQMVQAEANRHSCLHHSSSQELSPTIAQWRASGRSVE